VNIVTMPPDSFEPPEHTFAALLSREAQMDDPPFGGDRFYIRIVAMKAGSSAAGVDIECTAAELQMPVTEFAKTFTETAFHALIPRLQNHRMLP